MRYLSIWAYALLLLLIVPSCIPQQESNSTSTDSEEQAKSPTDDSAECAEEDKEPASYGFVVGCTGLAPGDPCEPCLELPKECYTCGDSDEIQCEGMFLYCESPNVESTPNEMPSGSFACNEILECSLVGEQAPYDACAGKATGDDCWPCDQTVPECAFLDYGFFYPLACDERGQCVSVVPPPYKPCEGKAPGEDCLPCDETTDWCASFGYDALSFHCDDQDQCIEQPPELEKEDTTDQPSFPCEGKVCGESCDYCAAYPDVCIFFDYDPDVFYCNLEGQCGIPPTSLNDLCTEDDVPCPEADKNEVTYSFTVGCEGLQPFDTCEPCLLVPEECYTCGESTEIICEGSYLYCWAPGVLGNPDDLPDVPFMCTANLECIPTPDPSLTSSPCGGKACGESCDPCAIETPECALIDYDPSAFFCDLNGECVVPPGEPEAQCLDSSPPSACEGKACGESCDPCAIETPECAVIDYNPYAFFCDLNGECVVPPGEPEALCLDPNPPSPCQGEDCGLHQPALHLVSQHQGCIPGGAWTQTNEEMEAALFAFLACMETTTAVQECQALLPQPNDAQNVTVIDIEPSTQPITLVLTSSESTLWKIKNPGNTPINEVLFGGVYSQEIEGLDSSISVTDHTSETGSGLLHYAIDLTPDFLEGSYLEGDDFYEEYLEETLVEDQFYKADVAYLKLQAQALTGLDLSSYQSGYSGYTFQVGPGTFNTDALVHAVSTHNVDMPSNTMICEEAEEHGIIQVGPSEQPVILLLMAYDPTHWEIQMQPGANLGGIILGGYHTHRVTGVPTDIAVEHHGFYTAGAPDSLSLNHVNSALMDMMGQSIEEMHWFGSSDSNVLTIP